MQDKELKQECIERLKILNIPVLTKAFQSDKILLSEFGTLWNLSEKELNIINEFEKNSGNKVYHIVHNVTDSSIYYLFFVSNNKDNWEKERDLLIQHIPYVSYCYDNNFDKGLTYAPIMIYQDSVMIRTI